jgi:hypothetical protein
MGQAIAQTARPVAPYSRLYCRLNGFMLGVFFEMSWRKSARRRYGFYRERMRVFLREVGIEDTPPRTHAECAARYDRGFISLTLKLGLRSEELRDFFHLGAFSIASPMAGPRQQAKANQIRRWATAILTRHGLDPGQWKTLPRFLHTRPRDIYELISPSLTLLVETLRNLRVEPQTCFVAMPFRKPFESYYATLYRPLLAAAGYRAIRAWGGFGDEDFSPLLVAAIIKSGAMLADLTGWNPNVLWELGIAQGAGRVAFLLRRDDERRALSDLARHLTIRYRERDTRAPGMNRLIFPMTLAKDVLRLEHGDPIRVAAGARAAEFGAYGDHLVERLSQRVRKDQRGRVRSGTASR